jgi:hypothetical protein
VGFLGLVLALLGAVLVVRAIRGVFAAPHPRQIGAALLLPLGVIVATLGALLLVVPDFFAS